METLWFCLVAFMLTGYVLLDGFDLGAGIVHLWIARTDSERRQIFQSIGPVWDGNEVWLLAGGGTLYFAFPGLYASSFSGFYLPLMIVLWLLILRGASIEFRNQIQNSIWPAFWDTLFALGSTLLAVFYGAALGNFVRGVPLDKDGDFFLPLWTNFRLGPDAAIFDWYTILVGLLAGATLAMHGALWVNYKTEGALQQRSQAWGRNAWLAVVTLTVVVTAATFWIQPLVPASFGARPWGFVFPALATGGLAGVRRFLQAEGKELTAFLFGSAFIAGMLASVAFGLYPYMLPSNSVPELSLTVYNTATAPYGLTVALAWWVPGMLLACGYSFFLYRRFAGKVREDASYH